MLMLRVSMAPVSREHGTVSREHGTVSREHPIRQSPSIGLRVLCYALARQRAIVR